VRWVALIAVLAGCGRYGFDRTLDMTGLDDAALDDAGPDDGRNDDARLDGATSPGDGAQDGVAAICPTQYSFAIGSSRYRLGGQTTWTAAEASCEADGAGIHLVVIDAASEMTALAALSGGSRTWVGISDRKTDNVFLRVIGGVAPYLPWRSGDPSQGGSACAAWDPPSEYRDESCGQGRQYICECDGIPADPTAY
jgi:Lectin C-type domain